MWHLTRNIIMIDWIFSLTTWIFSNIFSLILNLNCLIPLDLALGDRMLNVEQEVDDDKYDEDCT